MRQRHQNERQTSSGCNAGGHAVKQAVPGLLFGRTGLDLTHYTRSQRFGRLDKRIITQGMHGLQCLEKGVALWTAGKMRVKRVLLGFGQFTIQ